MLYQTRDHSSSAVNRVLHDQAHALTGLLYDTLLWTAMTASSTGKFKLHTGPLVYPLIRHFLKFIFMKNGQTKLYFQK